MDYREEIIKIVQDIFSSMLGGNVSVMSVSDGETLSQDFLTGKIDIAGDWQGSVVLYFPKALARSITETMFGMGPGEAGEAEINDAIGEITNMTGGGFKCLRSGSCQLSLPQVIAGRINFLAQGSRQKVSSVDLSYGDDVFSVVVCE